MAVTQKFSDSPLVVYTMLSPNRSDRKNNIDTITVHHMAGNLTVETCGNIFSRASRQASSNYGIGTDGRIALYVHEKDRSWCSSTGNAEGTNDHRAITIEVANDEVGNNWHVSDKALASLIELCVDICKRNEIKQLIWNNDKESRIQHKNGTNMTMHKDFFATACPGPYLASQLPFVAQKVNERLGKAIEVEVKMGIVDVDGVQLDLDYYYNTYADLRAAFGKDKDMLILHWKTYGKNEGRKASANYVAKSIYEERKETKDNKEYKYQTKEEFIEMIAKLVAKYNDSYGIKLVSVPVAQACMESGYGTSELAVNCNNFFGMKFRQGRTPTAYPTPYYKEGSEQNPDGSYSSWVMKWANFPTIEAGVQGYFDFINVSNYANLKGITDPDLYIDLLRKDGYWTSLDYDARLKNFIRQWNLTRFDKEDMELPEAIETNTYTVEKGDSLSKIGVKTNTNWQEIAKINNIQAPYIIRVGQILTMPEAQPVYYNVQKCDTLNYICNKYDTTLDIVLNLNPQITNPNIIKVNQQIRVK